MASSITWVIDGDAKPEARVVLSGDVTENANLGQLLGQLPQGPLALDLSGIKRINSVGVREWIQFVDGLKKAGRSFTLERCSVPIVGQLNMISNFAGGAKVRSFFAPFYCSNCNSEQPKLIDATNDPASQLSSPDKCSACGGELEFDDLPDAFLAFTRS